MKHKVQCVVLFEHWYSMTLQSCWKCYKICAMYGAQSIDLPVINECHSKNEFIKS